jgi:hypothetical protein
MERRDVVGHLGPRVDIQDQVIVARQPFKVGDANGRLLLLHAQLHGIRAQHATEKVAMHRIGQGHIHDGVVAHAQEMRQLISIACKWLAKGPAGRDARGAQPSFFRYESISSPFTTTWLPISSFQLWRPIRSQR